MENMKFPHEALDLTDRSLFVPYQTPYESLQRAAELILKSVGENTEREGLLRTPHRFAKAYTEICGGYRLSPQEAVGEGIFQGEGGLVSVRDIDFFSLCEHHMLPFWGQVSVAYLPKDKILGLSKIPRLVEVFAKRLQVQERLAKEIASGIAEVIDPVAVAVRIKGSHMCMMMRGVKKTGSETVTEYSIGLEKLSNSDRERIWKSID
jgi:GTP cyclohydrolase I